MAKVRIPLLLIAALLSHSAQAQDAPLHPDTGYESLAIEVGLKGLDTEIPGLLASLKSAREAVEMQRSALGPDSPELVALLTRQASLESKVNERRNAAQTLREGLRIAEKSFGQHDYRTRTARVELEAAERVARLSDAQFADLQRARGKIGFLLVGTEIGDADKARLAAEAHETMRDLSGVGSRECENGNQLRVNQALAAKQFEEAIRLIDRDLGKLKEVLGDEHPGHINALLWRSIAQAAIKDFGAAEAGLREAADLLMKAPEGDAVVHAAVFSHLCLLLAQAGRLEEAAEVASRWVDLAERNSPSDRLPLADALTVQSGIAVLQEKDDLVISGSLRAIEIESSPEGRPLKRAKLQRQLAESYVKQKRWAEAEPVLKSCLPVLEKASGPTDKQTLATASGLAACYLHTEQWAEAESLLKRIHSRLISRSGRDSEESRKVRDLRVGALRAMGKETEADELLREPRPFVVPAAGP